MARYFYDHFVGESSITLDEDGCVCCDDDVAVRFGRKRLASLLASDKSTLPWQQFELIVRREDGAHVGRINMTVETEPQSSSFSVAQPNQPNGRAG